MTTGGAISQIDPSDVPQYTDAELAAVVEEAHRFNKPVAAHAHGAEGVKLALRNGIDTIEHGVSLDEEAIDALVESGAALVPTLVVYRRLVEKGAEHGLPDYALRTAEEVAQTHVESIRRAHEAGVPIALGTDATGNPPNAPHGASADEAVIYVEDVGMSEMEAIRSATSAAARALADDRIGAIEPGRRADLVALSSDPLADIEALYDVESVYTDGDRAPV